MISAKEYLHIKGVTDALGEAVTITRGTQMFDITEMMEQYAAMVKANPDDAPKPSDVHVFGKYTPRFINIMFEVGMQTGYMVNGTYYPLDKPVPRSMDREYAILTTEGPKVVKKGTMLIKDTASDKIVGIIKND